MSTDSQSLSAQLAELKAAKCAKIFQEKISGARSDRKQLTRLMAGLAKGDVLIVTVSIDWQGPHAISSICWGQSPTKGRGSNR